MTTHGQTGTRLHRIWKNMKARCGNPKTPCYAQYGGRGIKVCDEWQADFVAFRDWALANGYAEHLELDRRENNGGYSPANCRWVTHQQNHTNTRQVVLVTAFGETKSLTQWSLDSRCSVTFGAIKSRIDRGWSPEQAITTPRKDYAAKERTA